MIKGIHFTSDEDRAACLNALIKWYLATYPEGTSLKMTAEEIVHDLEQSTSSELLIEATVSVG